MRTQLPGDDILSAALEADGPMSRLAGRYGLQTFRDAVAAVKKLPYRRNSRRSDYSLVLIEGQGVCSTKHASLADLASENSLPVDLVLGIFEMTEANTPGVGKVLAAYGLEAIPEAHCFLRGPFGTIDVTMPADSPSSAKIFIYEEVIQPDDIGEHKAAVHRRLLRAWARERKSDLDVGELWMIREECIAALSAAAA